MANALNIHTSSALLDRLRDEVEAIIVADQIEGLKKSKAYLRVAEEAVARHQLALKYTEKIEKALSYGNKQS